MRGRVEVFGAFDFDVHLAGFEHFRVAQYFVSVLNELGEEGLRSLQNVGLVVGEHHAGEVWLLRRFCQETFDNLVATICRIFITHAVVYHVFWGLKAYRN